MANSDNYLERELDELISSDAGAWAFLQKASLDGVWYWDLENPEHEWMSPEFWQLFGIDPATKAHSPSAWQDIIFQEDLALALKNFEGHCADPSVPYDQIVRYRHADGSVVWVRCRGLAVRDEAGKPVRMLGAHTDLTAVKRSEQISRANARRAQAANADLYALSYSVSHDLNAPTNTLKLLLSELEHQIGPQIDPEAHELVQLGHQAINRMQQQLDDVLAYTQLVGADAGFGPVALDDCARQATKTLQRDIAASGARVTLGDLPQFHGSAIQMALMFENLLDNAIKFHAPNTRPEVDIECYARDERYEITVRDNGIGIPEKDAEKVFGLFKRLHTREVYDGSGVGLSMCQRIAHNHKGHIRAAANPNGQGTAVTVSLPRHAI